MLKHGRIGMMRPEQFPQPFKIYRQGTGTNATGRERPQELVLHGEARCILSVADPKEQERFRQTAVTVTHMIIQRGAPIAGKDDFFVLAKGGAETRKFRVQAVHNKGEMDIDTVYYCDERSDLK